MEKKMNKFYKFLSRPQEYYPNFEIFSYHLLKALKKYLARLKLITGPGSSSQDMFNWSLYNIHYRGEIKKDSKEFTISLKAGDYVFADSRLKKTAAGIKPLHHNWQLIYETILKLEPASVLEFGCGNGMHLHNIHVLAPEIKLFGLDRSQEQIDFLHESYPDLPAQISLADATAEFSAATAKADLAFTQAVIMHIRTGQTHLTALTNLFNSAAKQVLLMEKWTNHSFMADIKKLHAEGKIRWPDIYYYYGVSSETNQPHIMICSAVPLNFPALDDYSILK